MNSITFSYNMTWKLILKLLRLCNKYTGNANTLIEI